MKRIFMIYLGVVFVALCLVATPIPAQSDDSPTKTIQNSINVLNEMVYVKGIPPEALKMADGIVIIPGVTKIALGVGGQHGTGVAVERVDGGWSPPFFVSISGASVGAEIGVESTDLVLLFKNRPSFQKVLVGNFKIGVSASAAAGPSSVHGYTSSSADVLAYKKTEGAFAGASLDGSDLHVDKSANQLFYSNPNVTAEEIVKTENITVPPEAKKLDQNIERVSSSVK